VVIIVKGTVTGEDDPIGPIPWRSAAVITGAIIFFGATIRDLGVVPTTFVTSLVAGFAGRRPGVVAPVVIGLGLTVASVVIFVWALQLTLPAFGDWIPV
jgi:hypothetical protein